MAVAFWLFFGALFTVYVGYPGVMALVAAGCRRRGQERTPPDVEEWPTVTVVIAARNEADRLEAKLASVFAQSYPGNRLQVVVVSDGSIDGSGAVARKVRDERLQVLELPTSRGKAAALNAGLAVADGEIIVFTDARQPLDARAVEYLVVHFRRSAIGAVSGDLNYPDGTGEGWTSALRGYWAYERRIRLGETRIDSCVGVTGALYAIRRKLWNPLPEGLILDDVYTPMRIVLSGYRVVYEPAATALESYAPHEQAEFARRVRTLTGNYQLLAELPSILVPWRNRIWTQYMLHKVGRLASPFLLLGVLISSAAAPGGLFDLLFGLQALGWTLGAVSLVVPGRLATPRGLTAIRAFTLGQISLVVAFAKFVAGDTDVWVSRSGTASKG